MKKLLLFLTLLFGGLFAFNAAFQGSDPSWHFNTDMQISNSFTASSGGSSLSNGASVCSASPVTIGSSGSSKWGASSIDIVSIYPDCPPDSKDPSICSTTDYYPQMSDSSSKTTNNDVTWLDSAVFDSQYSFAQGNDFSQEISNYNLLKTFYPESMTYEDQFGFHNNKLGSANVFCKGTLEVYDGSTLLKSVSMDKSSSVDVTLLGAGSHKLTTKITGVSCFGSVVKSPVNNVDHPEYFYLYYFALNAPTISPVPSSNDLTIDVTASSGTCSLGTTSIVGTTTDGDSSLVIVSVTNTGDPVKATAVSSSNPAYAVGGINKLFCDALGLNLVCPVDSGFSKTIPTGGTQQLAVLVTKIANTNQDTTITFNAELVNPACGGVAATCSATALLKLNTTTPPVPVKCTISPDPATLGTNEIGAFTRTCFDMANNPVACDPGTWSWAGLSGNVISSSPDAVHAFTTSPPGSSGQIRFVSAAMTCQAAVNVVAPNYGCGLVPPNSQLNFGDSQNFALNCAKDNDPAQPQKSSTFILINGLVGNLNPAGNTALYTAPDLLTQGELLGYGEFDPNAFITGAVAFAHINVINGSANSNDTNASCLNCNKNDGSTEHCTIGDGPLSVYDGYSAWIGIKCGPKADTSCSSVQWFIDKGTIDPANINNPLGTTFHASGKEGDVGEIKAIIDGKPGNYCTRKFTIGSQLCWQVT